MQPPLCLTCRTLKHTRVWHITQAGVRLQSILIKQRDIKITASNTMNHENKGNFPLNNFN